MRIDPVGLSGLLLVTSSAVGCNAVLGVDDVAPILDAGQNATSCGVDAHFSMVSPDPAAGASLIHLGSGAPSLLIVLHAEANPDALFLRLYDNMGGHGVVNAPGTYQLLAGDALPETCAVCTFIDTDFDRSTNTFSGTYAALARGELKLTVASATRLAGTLRNVQYRHVDTSGATRDINDGCMVTIDTVVFDMAYSASAAP